MILIYGSIGTGRELLRFAKDNSRYLERLGPKDYFIFYAAGRLPEEREAIEWLTAQPFTTLLMDGDTEVYACYEKYGPIKKLGGMMHRLSDRVFHFADSGIYRFDGQKVLVANMCAALRLRDPGYYDYCRTRMKHLIRSAENNHYTVDTVISCIPPLREGRHFSAMPYSEMHAIYMDRLMLKLTFKEWYFSAYEVDRDHGDYHCVHAVPKLVNERLFTKCSE